MLYILTSTLPNPLVSLCRVLEFSLCPGKKMSLHIDVRYIELTCCAVHAPLWRPLERVQRRSTKFILSDYTSDYKTRLMQLGSHFTTYVYIYEIADIVFFINSINNPTQRFNILNYVDFSTGSIYKICWFQTLSQDSLYK